MGVWELISLWEWEKDKHSLPKDINPEAWCLGCCWQLSCAMKEASLGERQPPKKKKGLRQR